MSRFVTVYYHLLETGDEKLRNSYTTLAGNTYYWYQVSGTIYCTQNTTSGVPYAYTQTTQYGSPIDLTDVSTFMTRPGYYINPAQAWRVGSKTSTTYLAQNAQIGLDMYTSEGGFDLHLYPNWLPVVCEITLNGNGATVPGTTKIYTKYRTGVYADQSCTTSISQITIPQRKYTVSFNGNGGTSGASYLAASYVFGEYSNGYITNTGAIPDPVNGIASAFITNGTLTAQWGSGSVTLPSAIREGYIFNGWYTAASGGTKIGNANASFTPTSSLTLYAQWTIKTYTVTYSANGGTGAPASQTKTHGTNLTLASGRPTRTGYTFTKWNTKADGSGTNYASGGTYTGNAALILYAQWTPDTYTVAFNANGGSGAPASQTKTYGVNLTLSTVRPSRTGYTFKCWNTLPTGLGTDYAPGGTYNANAGATLYAVWTPNAAVTVSYNANGGTGAPAYQSGLVGTGINLSTTIPTKANTSVSYTVTYNKVDNSATLSKASDTCTRVTTYKFKCWNTKADGTGTNYSPGQAIVLQNVLALYAIWTSETTGSVTLPTGTLSMYALSGFTASQSTPTLVSNPYVATKNITLYAVWTPDGSGGLLTFPRSSALPDYITANAKIRLVGLGENDGVYTVDTAIVSGGKAQIRFNEDFVNDAVINAAQNNFEIYSDGSYVPDFDYICSMDNRLYGCSSKLRTIYASALGDPTDFWTFEGTSLDAYQVAVGSAGDFTGCVAMNGSVMFSKQHCVHRLAGSYPAEYTLITREFDGASDTNGLGMVNCDGTVIYISEHGIGNYNGSAAGIFSGELGWGDMYDAEAAYNGEQYFLSYKDSDRESHSYTYDKRYGIWLQQDYSDVINFAHLGDKDYALVAQDDGNGVYLLNTGSDLDDEWEITFKPFVETYTSSRYSTTEIFEKKRYTRISIRMELPEDSWMRAEVSADEKPFYPVARIAGKKELVQTMVIQTPRCDKLQLRLTGSGPMTILSMTREYTVGSRR